MNTTIKIILLLSVLLLSQILFISHIFNTSRQLSMFGNLPHRYLGGMFLCTYYQPHKEIYKYHYMLEWTLADQQELFLEGQKRPVVPMLIVRTAREFPNDPDFQSMRKMIMHNHFNKVSREAKEKLEEEKKNKRKKK